MGTLIIKVTKDGASREYLLNKAGSVIIGSSDECDIQLKDDSIEAKLIEVKLNSGDIFVKELGIRAQVFMGSRILPFRENILYHNGEILSFANSNYQIQITSAEADSANPPPFITEDLRYQLEDMKNKLRDREYHLANTEKELSKKESAYDEIDFQVKAQMCEKNKRDFEISNLKKQQFELSQELEKKRLIGKQEETKLAAALERIERLKTDDQVLTEKIGRNESVIFQLKSDIERSKLEMKDYKIKLEQLNEVKTQNELLLSENKSELDNLKYQASEEVKKLNTSLSEIDFAKREKKKLESTIDNLKKEVIDSTRMLELSKSQVSEQEKKKRTLETQYQTLVFDIERSQSDHNKIKNEIALEESNIKQLINSKEELLSEARDIEDKYLSQKRISSQLAFDIGIKQKQLNTYKVEIEKLEDDLDQLQANQKSQENKLSSLRKEEQELVKRSEFKRVEINASFEIQKKHNEEAFREIEQKASDERQKLTLLIGELNQLQEKHADFISVNSLMMKECSDLETKVETLHHHRSELIKVTEDVKNEKNLLFLEKNKLESELSILKSRIKECENSLRQKESAAILWAENFQREEKLKLDAQKDAMLAEVETTRQHALLEVDLSIKVKEERLEILKREKFQEVDDCILKARSEAQSILSKAHLLEHSLSIEASERLKKATQEANYCEDKAHQRIVQAQDYYREKEKEAEVIILNSKKIAEELVKLNEQQVQEDLDERKKRIKSYIFLKEQKSEAHFEKSLIEQSTLLKKKEKEVLKSLEFLKRKELKKIAKVRNEELSKITELTEAHQKEARLLKQENLNLIQNLRKQQEEELSGAKKAYFESLNQTKSTQQRLIKDEIASERNAFEKTKRQRVQIASQGIFNLMITSNGQDPSEDLKEQIRSTLEMAINGQDPEKHRNLERIIDFNPIKQKKIWPVLQKYSLNFGLPAVLAIILLADIGKVRTRSLDFISDIAKQKQSASDIFVMKQQKEWKEKYSFNPTTTVGFKQTLTENILYTTGYHQIMESETFQNLWILAVNDFMVKELELSEDLAINYISSEGSLVKELWSIRKDINPQFKDQSIKKMNSIEETSLGWLNAKISDPKKLSKFTDFRAKYFDQYYASQARPARTLASDPGIEE